MKKLNALKSSIACALLLSFTSLPLSAFNDPEPTGPVESSPPAEPVPEPQHPVCGDWPYCVIEKS